MEQQFVAFGLIWRCSALRAEGDTKTKEIKNVASTLTRENHAPRLVEDIEEFHTRLHCLDTGNSKGKQMLRVCVPYRRILRLPAPPAFLPIVFLRSRAFPLLPARSSPLPASQE